MGLISIYSIKISKASLASVLVEICPDRSVICAAHIICGVVLYIALCSFGGPLPLSHCRKLLPSVWCSCEAFYQRNTAETLNSWCCPYYVPLSIAITPSLSAPSFSFAFLPWMLFVVCALYTTFGGFSWRVLAIPRLESLDWLEQFWCDLICDLPCREASNQKWHSQEQ